MLYVHSSIIVMTGHRILVAITSHVAGMGVTYGSMRNDLS